MKYYTTGFYGVNAENKEKVELGALIPIWVNPERGPLIRAGKKGDYIQDDWLGREQFAPGSEDAEYFKKVEGGLAPAPAAISIVDPDEPNRVKGLLILRPFKKEVNEYGTGIVYTANVLYFEDVLQDFNMLPPEKVGVNEVVEFYLINE